MSVRLRPHLHFIFRGELLLLLLVVVVGGWPKRKKKKKKKRLFHSRIWYIETDGPPGGFYRVGGCGNDRKQEIKPKGNRQLFSFYLLLFCFFEVLFFFLLKKWGNDCVLFYFYTRSGRENVWIFFWLKFYYTSCCHSKIPAYFSDVACCVDSVSRESSLFFFV